MLEEVNQDSLYNYILALQNLGTRYALADNTREVALWIKRKFESFGYENVVLDSLLHEDYGMQVMQYNVICKSDSIYSHSDYVLLGAHHDSHTFASPTDSAPGADDNASGTAGVLEIARIMKQFNPDTKIPFHYATWAAEEEWMVGSYSFVERYAEMDSLPLFYLNLDMIGNANNGNRKVKYNSSGGMEYFSRFAGWFSELEPVYEYLPGDNIPFIDAGVPTFYFAEFDFSDHYHQESDLLEYLEMDYAAEIAKAALATYYYAANIAPKVEIEKLQNAGLGDDFYITWYTQENAHSYVLDVYHNDTLIQHINTEDDSLYVNDLPYNEAICFELYSISNENDTIGGVREKRCFSLSHIPERPVCSYEINLDQVVFTWSHVQPLDADSIIIERKMKTDIFYEAYDRVSSGEYSFDIANHEPGFWEYKFSVKDYDGNVSAPAYTGLYATTDPNAILVVSGRLGGYGSPTHSDVIGFYEDILPLNRYYFCSQPADNKYMPSMNNFKAVIWNVFSSNNSKFLENREIIKAYVENGGSVLLFADKPQSHLSPDFDYETGFIEGGIGYNWGLTSMLENDGARLKQLQYSSGLTADVDPEKVPTSYNGSLPNSDVLVANSNGSTILTYESLADNSPENNFDGEPIAVKSGNSNVIVCGVPLYYFKNDEAKILIKKLLEDEMQVSISEHYTTGNTLELYPLPTKNTLNIALPKSVSFNGICQIYDITGKIVFSQPIQIKSDQIKTMQLPGLESGAYIFILDSQDIRYCHKILIN